MTPWHVRCDVCPIMRTLHLAPSLCISLLLASSSAVAQTVAAPTAAPWQGEAPPAAAPSASAADDAAEVRAMEGLLATLDADARQRRVLGLAVGIGGGAAVTGFGTWMSVRHDGRSWEDNWGLYVIGAGAGMMLGGVLTAVLPSYLHELGDSWRRSADLPVAARLARFGATLDELADQARSARRTSGWLALGLGAAMVVGAGVVYGVRDDSTTDSTWPGIFGVGGAFLMASSIPTLTIPSPVEHARLFWRGGAARPSVQLAGVSVMPTRGGALGGVSLVF